MRNGHVEIRGSVRSVDRASGATNLSKRGRVLRLRRRGHYGGDAAIAARLLATRRMQINLSPPRHPPPQPAPVTAIPDPPDSCPASPREAQRDSQTWPLAATGSSSEREPVLEFFVEGNVVVTITDRVERRIVVIVERSQHGGRVAVERIVNADSESGSPTACAARSLSWQHPPVSS